jgi:hypothetical protein
MVAACRPPSSVCAPNPHHSFARLPPSIVSTSRGFRGAATPVA